MTKSEFITRLKEEVKSLTEYLSYPIDYENALADAEVETNWTIPSAGITDTFQIFWLRQRARRHLFFMLLSDSAPKIKYGKASLQNLFTHYKALVEMMDRAFTTAVKENSQKFAGVDAHKLFGLVASTGFAYEPLTGRDITYDSDQKVNFSPTEND